MRKILFSLLFIPVLFLFSCTSPTENSNTDFNVTAFTGNNALTIINNMNQTIYLMVVESEYSARINWAPGYREPYVPSLQTLSIDYSKIANGKTSPVKSGDTVNIYYWTKSSGSNPEIHTLGIKL